MMFPTLARLSTSRRTLHRRVLLQWQRRRALGTTTYHDSQSGMDVPLHHEGTVSLYLDPAPDTRRELSKAESLLELHATGIAGVRLPKELTPNTVSLAESLASTAPGFTLFVPSHNMKAVEYPDNVNLLFELKDSTQSVATSLSKHLIKGTQTSVGLFDGGCYDREPIGVANNVASLIDEGGCNFVWLCPDENVVDEDKYIELVEQLSYLDVEGPTVKSRLVAKAYTDYVLEECLDFGVNKFVLHDFNSSIIESFRDTVEEKGKRLC